MAFQLGPGGKRPACHPQSLTTAILVGRPQSQAATHSLLQVIAEAVAPVLVAAANDALYSSERPPAHQNTLDISFPALPAGPAQPQTLPCLCKPRLAAACSDEPDSVASQLANAYQQAVGNSCGSDAGSDAASSMADLLSSGASLGWVSVCQAQGLRCAAWWCAESGCKGAEKSSVRPSCSLST